MRHVPQLGKIRYFMNDVHTWQEYQHIDTQECWEMKRPVVPIWKTYGKLAGLLKSRQTIQHNKTYNKASTLYFLCTTSRV